MVKKLITLLSTVWVVGNLFAVETASSETLSLPGYFGSINNNTAYVLECSQVIGGYCANTPMLTNGYIQMLPNPGSQRMRGHLLIYQKNVPSDYLEDITFVYNEQNNGQWQFATTSLYDKVNVKMLMPDTLILSDWE